MLLTWLYIVCTFIRHVLLIRSGHTELLIRSGYAAILFVTSIGPAVAKATWRHCFSHFIDRVAARTFCAVNVLTSRISFLVTLMDGSVVKHNMLKHLRKITKNVLFLQNNAPAHRAIATQKKLAYLGFQCLDHPPFLRIWPHRTTTCSLDWKNNWEVERWKDA